MAAVRSLVAFDVKNGQTREVIAQTKLNAYDQRLISTSAASDYLGVKPRHFNNIRRELTAKPAPTGP